MQQSFQIPDVVNNIAVHLRRQDQALLARASSICARASLPHLWRNVRGLWPLLKLLPGVVSGVNPPILVRGDAQSTGLGHGTVADSFVDATGHHSHPSP